MSSVKQFSKKNQIENENNSNYEYDTPTPEKGDDNEIIKDDSFEKDFEPVVKNLNLLLQKMELRK